MRINLSPMRRDDTLTVTKAGDVLTVNGEDFDFTPITDGATLPSDGIESDWIVGDISRVDGEIELTLILPIAANASEATAFPEPLVDVPDGEVALPRDPEPEEPEAPVDGEIQA